MKYQLQVITNGETNILEQVESEKLTELLKIINSFLDNNK